MVKNREFYYSAAGPFATLKPKVWFNTHTDLMNKWEYVGGCVWVCEGDIVKMSVCLWIRG